MRIMQWVTESNVKLHELVESDTNANDTSVKISEEQQKAVELRPLQQGAFTPKHNAANDCRHKCRPNRSNATECQNIDPQLSPCHGDLLKANPAPPLAQARSMADTFRSMVPDAIDAISARTLSVPQSIPVPAWLTTTCTASRK